MNRIEIDLSAGISAFDSDMDKATAKLDRFAISAGRAKSALASASDAAALGASLKALSLSVDANSKALAGMTSGLDALAPAQKEANQEIAESAKAIDKSEKSLEKLAQEKQPVEEVAKSLDHASEASKKLGNEGTPGVEKFARGLVRAVEAIASIAAADIGLKEFSRSLLANSAAMAGHAVSFGTWADRTADAARAVRLALSPTLATAGWIAAVIALEEAGKVTYREGGVLQRQSLTSGLNSKPLSPAGLQELSLAGRPENESKYLELFNSGGDEKGKNLREIAKALSAISDPFEKAHKAIQLFDGDAGKAVEALKLLDSRFVENADRVKDWGLVYDNETRQHILEFKSDLDSLKDPFLGLRDVIHDTLQQAKGEMVTFFAYMYDAMKKTPQLTNQMLQVFRVMAFPNLKAPEVGNDAFSSGTRGLLSVLGSAAKGSGHPENGKLIDASGGLFFGQADRQAKREQQELLGKDANLQGKLNHKDFPQNVIPDQLLDLTELNKGTSDLDGLKEKLSKQREARNKIFNTYFEVGGDGKTLFKNEQATEGVDGKKSAPLTRVEKANAVTSLSSTESAIRETEAKIKVAEEAKRLAEEAQRGAKEAAQLKATKFAGLAAESDASKLTLAAAGKFGETPTAKAEGEAGKVIAELDAALKHHGAALSDAEKAQIHLMVRTKELNLAEAEFQTKLGSSDTSIQARIQSQNELAAATVKGYEAIKQANVDAKLLEFLGPRANDAAWMKEHAPVVDAKRVQLAQDEESKHAVELSQVNKQLGQQIELEKSLAAVQEQGAEAIRLVTLAYEIRNAKFAGANDEQIRQMIGLSEATKAKESATRVTKLNDEIESSQTVTAALPKGAEAVREAELSVKYKRMQDDGAGADEIKKQKQLDVLQHQQEITAEALKTGISYQDELKSIDLQIAALQNLKATQGDSLAISISLKDLEAQRARVFADQVSQLGNYRDGIRAFFQEMATEGESAAQQVHDSLKGAFDGINDELAKLMSGQKTSWAGLFQSISADLSKMALKNLEAEIAAKIFPPIAPGAPGQPAKAPTGIRGVLGTVFGKPAEPSAIPGVPKGLTRDGQTSGSALFVTMIGTGGSTSIGPSLLPPLPTPLARVAKPTEGVGQGAPGGTISDVLTKLPSGLIQRTPKSALSPEDSANLGDFQNSELSQLAFGGYRADGGSVSKNVAHIVGEKGPELFVPDQPGKIVPNHELQRHLQPEESAFGKVAGFIASTLSQTTKKLDVTNTLDAIEEAGDKLRDGDWSGIRSLFDAVPQMRLGDLRGPLPQQAADIADTTDKLKSGDYSGAVANLIPYVLANGAPEGLTHLQKAVKAGGERLQHLRTINPLVGALMDETGSAGPGSGRRITKVPQRGLEVSQNTPLDATDTSQPVNTPRVGKPAYREEFLDLALKIRNSEPVADSQLSALNADELAAIHNLQREYKPRTQPAREPLRVEKVGKSGFEQVDGKFDSLTPDDDYYYHVTTKGNARQVLANGLSPSSTARSMSEGFYRDYSKGKAFLSDAGGVSYWQEKISNHLEDQGRSANLQVLRIPKGAVGGLEIDTLGVRDSNRGSYYATAQVAPGISNLKQFPTAPESAVLTTKSPTKSTLGTEAKTPGPDLLQLAAEQKSLSQPGDKFSEWFGKSRVVDAEGKPQRVYKGMPAQAWRTGEDIKELKSANGPWAGFFTSKPEVANRFAKAFADRTSMSPMVFPAYLNMENPYEVDAKGAPAANFQFDNLDPAQRNTELRKAIESKEFDGVIIRNTADEGDIFAPKHHVQIRPALSEPGPTKMPANFDGFRATGGDVSDGSSYVVGEKGPELFVPGSDGTIIPNADLSAFNQTKSKSMKMSAVSLATKSASFLQMLLGAVGSGVGAALKQVHTVGGPGGTSGFAGPVQRTAEPSGLPGSIGNPGLVRNGQTEGGALFVTLIGSNGSTSVGPSLSSGSSPISGGTPSLQPSISPESRSAEVSGAGSPSGSAGDVLTKLPSGLIQRERAANLTPEDTANLGDFQNSELGQLARGASSTKGIANEIPQSQSNTGAVLGAAGAAAAGAIAKGGPAATGKLAAFGGAKGLASTGVTLAFSLLPLLFNHKKDLHHKAGQPYTIPNFNGAFADGGPVRGGKTHLVGEKGPELFVPQTDGKIVPHHKLGSLATGSPVPFGGYRALGGSVDPSQAYMVGEKGPEMWIPPAQGSIVSNEQLSGRSAKSGSDVYIDARGTDPAAVEQRVRQGMAAAHNAAVRTSFRATQEFAKRTPPVKA